MLYTRNQAEFFNHWFNKKWKHNFETSRNHDWPWIPLKCWFVEWLVVVNKFKKVDCQIYKTRRKIGTSFRYVFFTNNNFFRYMKKTDISSKPHKSNRSRHQRCSRKQSVLRNFTKLTEKRLCQNFFLNKVAGLRTPLDNYFWSKCLLKPK